jgi:hypothetical protein
MTRDDVMNKAELDEDEFDDLYSNATGPGALLRYDCSAGGVSLPGAGVD